MAKVNTTPTEEKKPKYVSIDPSKKAIDKAIKQCEDTLKQMREIRQQMYLPRVRKAQRYCELAAKCLNVNTQ